jgi:hypothetical protein
VYVEVTASPTIQRLTTLGSTLALPSGVPSDPPAQGVLQYGPDHRLYPLIGRLDAPATLEIYPLP